MASQQISRRMCGQLFHWSSSGLTRQIHGSCNKLALVPESRVWFRAFDPKHMASPLGVAHTFGLPSRFSPVPASLKPFEILYLSETHIVCLREVGALLGSWRTSAVILPLGEFTKYLVDLPILTDTPASCIRTHHSGAPRSPNRDGNAGRARPRGRRADWSGHS
jgi:hypothetical protein